MATAVDDVEWVIEHFADMDLSVYVDKRLLGAWGTDAKNMAADMDLLTDMGVQALEQMVQTDNGYAPLCFELQSPKQMVYMFRTGNVMRVSSEPLDV